jgi:hypothetical protein
MELQHVNVKLMLANSEAVDLAPLIPVFHGWIRDRVCDELLLDLADYRHVHAGPGVVLIGHEADYSVDNTGGRLGVRYNRKAVLDGTNRDRLVQATRAALTACRRLESEPRLAGQLRFNGRDLELSINDRLLAPNREATRAAVEPELAAFSRDLFRGSEVSLSHGGDPRSVFHVSLRASQPFSVSDLLANLD